MKFFYVLLVTFVFYGCSFDNKTGIWKDDNVTKKKELEKNDNFKEINKLLNKNPFNETIT